jgi:SNF2 family DNA or RNA helicase
MRSLGDLRNAQKFLIDYALERPFCAWFADMGFGKTATAWTYIKILLDNNEASKVLIVAPKRVAQHTWPDELKLWQHLKKTKYSLITGEMNEIDRGKAALDEASVHIINRENLVWLWRFFDNGASFPYDVLVYDEASRLKSWKFRSAVVKKNGRRTGGRLNEYAVIAAARKKHFKRVLQLSGTPAPNGLHDLGGLIYILDLGERLGKNREEFLKRYFSQDKYTRKIEPKRYAFEKITEKISDICVTLKTEDYAELPQQINIPYWVDLSKPVMDKYKTLLRTKVLWEEAIRAKSAGVLAQKLLQLCNGSIYQIDDYGNRVKTIAIHDLKSDALKEIIELHEGTPLLVAYSYEFDRERIKQKFPQAVVFEEEENALEKWNRKEIPLLIAHPASIGHGLNLQHGSNVAVWYGLSWSLELYQQFNKRLVRPGQKESRVLIYHILSKNTYDERVWQVLQEKEITQDEVLNVLSVDKNLIDNYNK